MHRVLWGLGAVAILIAIDVTLPRFANPYIIQVTVLCGINVILAVSLNLINGFTGQFSIGHAGFMAIGAYGAAMFTLNVGQRWVSALAATGAPHGLAEGAALAIALLLGGLLAAVAGYLVGLP